MECCVFETGPPSDQLGCKPPKFCTRSVPDVKYNAQSPSYQASNPAATPTTPKNTFYYTVIEICKGCKAAPVNSQRMLNNKADRSSVTFVFFMCESNLYLTRQQYLLFLKHNIYQKLCPWVWIKVELAWIMKL